MVDGRSVSGTGNPYSFSATSVLNSIVWGSKKRFDSMHPEYNKELSMKS
jgi:hypothetical protein